MTTSELMEFCRNLALLRKFRDSDMPVEEANALELNERIRAGRSRIQDVYRKVKDRLEAVLDYGRVALGEEEFKQARQEVDDTPPEEPKKRGRPAKPKDQDLPGQADLFADAAADESKTHEDARREADRVNPDLKLDLEIMRVMRTSTTFIPTARIAQEVGCEPSDVAVRLAALEEAGRIRRSLQGGSWEVVQGDPGFASEGPTVDSEESDGPEGPPEGQDANLGPSDEKFAERMEPYAEAARAVLADGPVTTDPLIRAIAQRTGQAQTAVKESVMGWLSGDGRVIERDGPRGPWRLRTEAELVEAPPL